MKKVYILILDDSLDPYDELRPGMCEFESSLHTIALYAKYIP